MVSTASGHLYTGTSSSIFEKLLAPKILCIALNFSTPMFSEQKYGANTQSSVHFLFKILHAPHAIIIGFSSQSFLLSPSVLSSDFTFELIQVISCTSIPHQYKYNPNPNPKGNNCFFSLMWSVKTTLRAIFVFFLMGFIIPS